MLLLNRKCVNATYVRQFGRLGSGFLSFTASGSLGSAFLACPSSKSNVSSWDRVPNSRSASSTTMMSTCFRGPTAEVAVPLLSWPPLLVALLPLLVAQLPFLDSGGAPAADSAVPGLSRPSFPVAVLAFLVSGGRFDGSRNTNPSSANMSSIVFTLLRLLFHRTSCTEGMELL